MTKIFAVYFIDESTILGCYSSLELAIQKGHELLDNRHAEWCIVEKLLDAEPNRAFNNVYQNTYRIYENGSYRIMTKDENDELDRMTREDSK